MRNRVVKKVVIGLSREYTFGLNSSRIEIAPLDNREILLGFTQYESIYKQVCTDNGMMHIMGILEYRNEKRRHTSNEDK